MYNIQCIDLIFNEGPIINASSFMDILLTTVIPSPPRVGIDDRPIRQSPPPPTGPSGQFRVSEN
jgi:hypothetical protein